MTVNLRFVCRRILREFSRGQHLLVSKKAKLAEKGVNRDVVTIKHHLIPWGALVCSHLWGRGSLSRHIYTLTKLRYELPPGRGHDFGQGSLLWQKAISREGSVVGSRWHLGSKRNHSIHYGRKSRTICQGPRVLGSVLLRSCPKWWKIVPRTRNGAHWHLRLQRLKRQRPRRRYPEVNHSMILQVYIGNNSGLKDGGKQSRADKRVSL